MSAQQQEVPVLMDLSQVSFGALHSPEESSLPQITLVLYVSSYCMLKWSRSASQRPGYWTSTTKGFKGHKNMALLFPLLLMF